MLNTLLVGLGTRGRHWARVISDDPGSRLVAGVEPSAVSLRKFFEQLPQLEVPTFASLGEALGALAVDVVVLATPPEGHLEQIRICARHGVHVMCEKPLATSFEDARDAVALCQQARIHLGVGMNFRYLPCSQYVRDTLGRGELGRPGLARINYWRYRDGHRPLLNKYPLTMDQPMLLEQSIHHFDLARYIYQDEVRTVWAHTSNPAWSMYRSDATVTAWFEFAGGLTLSYFGTWMGTDAINEFSWRTDGELGMILQNEMFGGVEQYRAGSAEGRPVPLPAIEDFVDDTRGLWNAFLIGVSDSDTGPDAETAGYPTGHDHLRTLALTLACEVSSRTGQRIDFNTFLADLGLPDAATREAPHA
ncbi:Gfo/Idh/MocA family protein [Deinococcus sp. UYEF24]